jgi:putative membrane protein
MSPNSAEHGATSGTTGSTQPGMGNGAGMSGSTQSAPETVSIGTTGTTGATNSMTGSMDVSNLSDAQVAAVLQALNSGEIQQAQLAQSKSKSPEVKRFAQKMITAHREMQSSNAALFSRLQITPSDNAVSNQLKSDVQSDLTTLQGLSGHDFDRDYIDGQVRAHNHALELVDRMVMNVKSSELRTDLQNGRSKIEQHLREAERIQQTIEQGQQSQGASSKQPASGANSR